jgi:hypothetical protein
MVNEIEDYKSKLNNLEKEVSYYKEDRVDILKFREVYTKEK